MKKKLLHSMIMSILMGFIMPLIIIGSNMGVSKELISIWKSVLPKSIPVAFILGGIFNPVIAKLINRFTEK